MQIISRLCTPLLLLASINGISPKLVYAEAAPGSIYPITIDLIGGPLLSLAVSGETAYIGQGQGLTIFDISDPTNPERITSLPLPWDVVAVQILDNLAYVAAGELSIIDVSKRHSPKIIGNYVLEAPAQQVQVIG